MTTTTQPNGQTTGTPFVNQTPFINNWYGQPIPGAYQTPVNGTTQTTGTPMNGPVNGPVNAQIGTPINGQFTGQPTNGFVSPVGTTFGTPFNTQFTTPIWNQFQSPLNTNWNPGIGYTTPFNTLVNTPLNTQIINGQPIGFGGYPAQTPVQSINQTPIQAPLQGYTPSVFDFFPSTVFNRQPFGQPVNTFNSFGTGLNTPNFTNSFVNTTPVWNQGFGTFPTGFVNGFNTPTTGFNLYPVNQYPVNQYPVNQFPFGNTWNGFSPLNTVPTAGFNTPTGYNTTPFFNGTVHTPFLNTPNTFGQFTGNTFGQFPQWTNTNGFVPSPLNNAFNTPYLGQVSGQFTNPFGTPFTGFPVNSFPLNQSPFVNGTPWQFQSPFNTLNQFGTPFFGQPFNTPWQQPTGVYQTWSPIGQVHQQSPGGDLCPNTGLNLNRDAA